jgi:predicted negative regulator of RcsB-dependent stress response
VSDHLTRKELRQDNVALKVEEGVSYFTAHRKQIELYGGIALAVVLIVWGGMYYRSYSQGQRQQALAGAIQLQNATVGPDPTGGPNFPTDEAKKDAVTKAYVKVAADYSGSAEGYIAEYTLADIDIENGKVADARKKLEDVAAHAEANYASLARLSLAQLDASDGKTADAQTILKDLMDHPTDLVSKDQAAFVLARVLAPTNPAEARKLLVPLAGAQGTDASQAATTALSELPPQ